MSRTNETRLLMETWRKFINESNMSENDCCLDAMRLHTSMETFKSQEIDTNKDEELLGKIFWDQSEKELLMIIDSNLDETDPELTTISGETKMINQWPKSHLLGYGARFLDMQDLVTIQTNLNSEDVLAPGDFEKVYNFIEDKVEVRNSDTGEVLQSSDL